MVRRFAEKFFILILCLYHSYVMSPESDIVFLFLSSLILSILLDLFSAKKYRLGVYLLFMLLYLFEPLYLFYLPLILYNTYLDFMAYTLVLSPLLFINFSITGLLITAISIYLSATTNQYDHLVNKNKLTRDSLTEDALYLQKYNEQLQIDREKNIHIAILTERNRIARELHDSIGHAISSSILQVEALKIISKEHETIDPLNILQDTLKNGMEDIRNSIHNLYSESLDLESRINALGKDIPRLTIELNHRIEEELSYELKFDILSIAREAITNCVKHSNANSITINLFDQPKFYSIIIKDNGTYFDSSNNRINKGIGLSSMKEIAHKYDGFLNYGFDKGFKIHITLMKGQSI